MWGEVVETVARYFKVWGRCEEMAAYLNSDKSTLKTFGFASVASLCFKIMALKRWACLAATVIFVLFVLAPLVYVVVQGVGLNFIFFCFGVW